MRKLYLLCTKNKPKQLGHPHEKVFVPSNHLENPVGEFGPSRTQKVIVMNLVRANRMSQHFAAAAQVARALAHQWSRDHICLGA
jgi:hypothetical protein